MKQRNKPSLLITGGSGLLALNWATRMASDWDVTLLQHQRQVSVDGVRTVLADLGTSAAVVDLFNRLRPDLVVNTAALSNVEICEREPDSAYDINAGLAGRVGRAAHAVGAKFIHISTDHLFDGTSKLATELTPTSPVNVYGQSKLAGEVEALGAHPTALVLRTNFFGWGPAYRSSFSDFILRNLRSGGALHLFEDAFFSPILIEDLVETAHALIDREQSGIFNVAGAERTSKLDFGYRLAGAFALDPSRIVPTRLTDQKHLTTRPLDMSLDTSKLQRVLGHHGPDLASGLEKLRQCEATHPVKGLGPFMIPYGRHHIDADDRAAVAEFLNRDGWLTQGPTVAEFERAIAERVGAKYGVAVANGTAGLHLAALAAGLGAGDTLLTSPVTFVASANAARYCGADVAFADLDARTANISADGIAQAIARDDSIKVVCPVHFAGLPCDMAAIADVVRPKGIKIIEDAAHALGSSYPDRGAVGNCAYSDMTVFSFHPVKAIALGEGGLITTNDEHLYRALLRLRSHGINKLDDEFEYPEQAGPWYYEMQDLGFNYRLTDLQCALGLSQLKKLDRFVSRRQMLVTRYDAAFADHPTVRPAQDVDKTSSAHHIYVVSIDFEALGLTRAALMNGLREHGIGSQVHYVPVPMQPYYRKLGHSMSAHPNAQAYYDHCLTLPLYFDLSEDEQDQVIEVLLRLVETAATKQKELHQ